jgi:hypothetical protein
MGGTYTSMHKPRQDKSARSQKKVVHTCRRPKVANWDAAIEQARKKIATLQNSIQAFEEWRDSGEPFPSETLKQREASQ